MYYIPSYIWICAQTSPNPIFIIISVLTIICQVLIIQFGGEFINTKPLTLIQWVYTVLLAFIGIPVGILMRWIPIQDDPENYFCRDAFDIDDDFSDVGGNIMYHVEPASTKATSNYHPVSASDKVKAFIGDITQLISNSNANRESRSGTSSGKNSTSNSAKRVNISNKANSDNTAAIFV